MRQEREVQVRGELAAALEESVEGYVVEDASKVSDMEEIAWVRSLRLSLSLMEGSYDGRDPGCRG